MNKKIKVKLGPSQTTLLIPLLGRAVESRRKNGLLFDKKALEIVDALDYDFAKWKGSTSLIGASVRTLMIDEIVKKFIAENPLGTVVEIGCGLNTRFERLDNGKIHWFDLDLPDSIELRRNFFKDTERRSMLASSILESDWIPIVKAAPYPYIFISEAVIIYLENEKAKKAITAIAKNFPNSFFVTDTTCAEMVNTQGSHDAMKYLAKDAWFKWKCDDPKDLERWGVGLTLGSSHSFLDASDEIKNKLPWIYKIFIKYLPFLVRKKIQGYLINAFQIK